MYSVELYRRLQAGESPAGLGRERQHQGRLAPRAAGGDPAAGSLGAHLRAAAGRRSPPGGRRPLPARRSRRRDRRVLPGVGRAARPVAAAPPRSRPAPARAASGSTSAPGSLAIDTEGRGGCPGADGPRRRGVRGGRRLRRHVRGRDRPARGGARADRADVAPVRGDRGHAGVAGERPSGHLPSLRDPDLLVYFRQEVDGLRPRRLRARPRAVHRDDAPGTTRSPPTSTAACSPTTGRGWRRSRRTRSAGCPRSPTTGIRRIINGPEGFTPDNEFCLGETEVAGLFVAAGFCAHGIAGAGGIGKVDGRVDRRGRTRSSTSGTWTCGGSAGQYRSPVVHARARPSRTTATYYDIAYPGRQRSRAAAATSPVYAWHRRARRGVRREGRLGAGGATTQRQRGVGGGREDLRPKGWAGRDWSPAIVAEHLATRGAAGLFDESSFAKLEVRGPGAAVFLERVCDNRVARGVGDVTYTQCLNARGGIEMRLHRHPARARTRSGSSPAPPAARATWPGCAGRPAPSGRRRPRRRQRRGRSASRCGGRARARCWRASPPRTCPTPPSRS